MRRVLQGDRLIYIRPTPHHPSGAPLHHHIHPTVRAHRCGKTLGRFPLQPAGGSLRFATLPFVVAGAGGRAYLGAPRGAPCLRAPLGPSAPAPYHGFRRKNQNNKESHPPPLRFLTCKTYVAREISAQPTQPNRGMREADDRKNTRQQGGCGGQMIEKAQKHAPGCDFCPDRGSTKALHNNPATFRTQGQWFSRTENCKLEGIPTQHHIHHIITPPNKFLCAGKPSVRPPTKSGWGDERLPHIKKYGR
jgi:hypothetical protein